MANTDDMIDVAQGKLEQFISENRAGVGKPKQGMVREDSPQTHSPGVEDRFMTETTQAGVSVDYVDLLADDDVPKNWKEGENRGHSRLAVYNKEGNVVDLESIGKVPDSGAALVGMSNDNDFVAAINEFLD